jgi:tRNA U34 5-methylaminomethyl-2-thiouridine-forming methyltransferase MnmC
LSEIKIITTGDGSHSLLNEALNETYHSRHGAIRESQHVFIEHGLNCRIKQHQLRSISILEVGFGTGLNALLSVHEAIHKNVKIAYSTLEKFPIQPEIWRTLNYPDPYDLFNELHQVEWHRWMEINSNFKLLKLKDSLQEVMLLPDQFDLIYFDAFAPNKQPEMWEHALLEKISKSMNSGAVFVTYCAKGQLKRDLKSLGLVVESLPGPPGKREMVRAIKM